MKKSQAGFSAIEGLLAVIAVTLVVFVGFYVYNTHNKANSTLDKAAHSTQQSTAVKKKQTAERFLSIKELGIKIPLSDKISGLQYTLDQAGGSTALLSIPAFSRVIANCQSDATGSAHAVIGSVAKVSGTYDPNSPPVDFFSDFSKQFDGFYLTYGNGDGGVGSMCSDKSAAKVQAAQAVFDELNPLIKDAVKRSEAL